MSTNRAITVFGAYGHTGRFVVAELCRRGWTPVLSGRDPGKLEALSIAFPTLECRPASVDDPAALDRALAGAAAVINCAGPFLDTAQPLIEAALRARIGYLDVAAEQQTVLDTFERYADTARDAGIAVLPGMAFYGGLADLLATVAMGDWPDAEAIDVAVALDSWHPTLGTRLTGKRNHYRRRVIANGQLDFLADPPPTRDWDFPPPFGTHAMVAAPLSETITISRHLRVQELHSYISLVALRDVRDPTTPPPVANDTSGRSSQRFAMEVVVRKAGQTPRRRGRTRHLRDLRPAGRGGDGAHARRTMQDVRRDHGGRSLRRAGFSRGAHTRIPAIRLKARDLVCPPSGALAIAIPNVHRS
jgi:short subunit dehydrogenase-like uncharacterized protein